MLLLLLYVIVLGIIAYGVKSIPMDETFRVIAYCIVLILLVCVLFGFFGIGPAVSWRR